MKKFFPVALLVLGSVINTRAQQVISHLVSVAPTSTDWTQTLQVPRFDSSLGTLTQVKLIYTGEIAQSYFLENTLPVSHHFSVFTSAAMSLEKPTGDPLFDLSSSMLVGPITLGAFDHVVDFAGTSGTQLKNSFQFSGELLDPELSDYLEAGLLPFHASASVETKLRAGADAFRSAEISALADFTVEYTYTPFAAVPEPAAYAAIVGVTVLASVVVWRRRRDGLLPSWQNSILHVSATTRTGRQ